MMILETTQNLSTQDSLSETQLHQMKLSLTARSSQIGGKSISQYFGEQRMGVWRCVEVTLRTEDLRLGGVVAAVGIVKAVLHEALEGDRFLTPRQH